MRVALHTPFIVHKNTGIARHIFGLLRGLAEVDRDTKYICFWPPNEPWPDWLPANFQQEPLTIAGDNPLVRVLKEQSWIAKAHKTLGFDVLHSPFGYLPPRPPCPTVVTVHDCRWIRYPKTFTRLRGTFLRWAIPRAIRQAKVTVTISQEMRKEILQYVRGASPERVRVLYPGVDAFWHSPTNLTALEKMQSQLGMHRFILAVGTQEPHKNLPRLVRAFGSATRKLAEETNLYLVGVKSFSTGKADNLEQEIAQSGVSERIHRLGAISDEELKAAYSLADALCFPSYYEGFGYPPLEAMAQGTPAISSRASCIPEVVGEAAELADPFSETEIADALARVLNSAARQEELRERGFAQVRRYTWRAHAEGIAAAYREAANA